MVLNILRKSKLKICSVRFYILSLSLKRRWWEGFFVQMGFLGKRTKCQCVRPHNTLEHPTGAFDLVCFIGHSDIQWRSKKNCKAELTWSSIKTHVPRPIKTWIVATRWQRLVTLAHCRWRGLPANGPYCWESVNDHYRDCIENRYDHLGSPR